MIRDARILPDGETMRTMRRLAPPPGGSDRRPLEVRLAGRPGSIDLCGLCSRRDRCLRKGTRRACRFPAYDVLLLCRSEPMRARRVETHGTCERWKGFDDDGGKDDGE